MILGGRIGSKEKKGRRNSVARQVAAHESTNSGDRGVIERLCDSDRPEGGRVENERIEKVNGVKRPSEKISHGKCKDWRERESEKERRKYNC